MGGVREEKRDKKELVERKDGEDMKVVMMKKVAWGCIRCRKGRL